MVQCAGCHERDYIIQYPGQNNYKEIRSLWACKSCNGLNESKFIAY